MSTYITLGISKEGEIYGLELKKDGNWRENSLGYYTSCVVIRPVDKETLSYNRDDPESVLDDWKYAVEQDRTQDSLQEYWEDLLADVDGEEDWPGKDDSFVYDLLEDDRNPSVAAYNATSAAEKATYRESVEWLIQNCDKVGLEPDAMATWEASGSFPPNEPFAIPLAPTELLEQYYQHLEKTCKNFHR